jgi:single-strand DNA-binding protein
MNTVTLLGRWVKPMELRYSTNANNTAILKNTLAVNRQGKKDEADFINVTMFGKTAEFVGQYSDKGLRMVVVGHIQTGSYEKDGVKHYTTDVIADRVEPVDWKGKDNTEQAAVNTFGGTPEPYESAPF